MDKNDDSLSTVIAKLIILIFSLVVSIVAVLLGIYWIIKGEIQLAILAFVLAILVRGK